MSGRFARASPISSKYAVPVPVTGGIWYLLGGCEMKRALSLSHTARLATWRMCVPEGRGKRITSTCWPFAALVLSSRLKKEWGSRSSNSFHDVE